MAGRISGCSTSATSPGWSPATGRATAGSGPWRWRPGSADGRDRGRRRADRYNGLVCQVSVPPAADLVWLEEFLVPAFEDHQLPAARAALAREKRPTGILRKS